MFQRARKHINPASILALVALVFAVTGGAFAATGGNGNGGGSSPAKASASTGRAATFTAVAAKKKAAPKGKAGPRGPAGPKGATGATGPAGATGPGGAQGPQGPAGTNGTNGTNGENGKQGEPGKTEIKTETNIAKTLPSGATETGAWSFTVKPEDKGQVVRVASLSFVIPLAGNEAVTKTSVIASEDVHIFAKGETATAGEGCATGSAAKPEAEPGNLCIYVASAELPGFETTRLHSTDPALSGNPAGAGATGAALSFFVPNGLEETGEAYGTSAVSAP